MKCPNCNGEIGRFELAPNCKHCGVNIFYSQQEALLTRDAKKCELEYASFHILSAKLKNAFIGGPVQILRIVSMVLAIGAIFIPFAEISVDTQLFDSKISFGAFGVYQAVSDGSLTAFISLRQYIPDLFGAVVALSVLFVSVFLSGFGVFGALLLSFLNIKKAAKASCLLSALGVGLSLGALGVSLRLPHIAAETFFTASAGSGAGACAFILAFIFILNLIVIKKDIKPNINEVDLRRVEIREKVKNGEISIDDLPLPILESDEEREKRLEAEKESQELALKAKGGEGNG